MATNFYFRNQDARNEQVLIEDLIVEAIRMYGIDMIYIEREVVNRDNIITDDKYSRFRNTYPLEMYVKNVEGFEGDGDFLSKFGLEIRDRMTLTMSRRSFKSEVTDIKSDLIRPREGDLVYFPLNRKFFEIKFVEHEAVFYQMGSLQTFDVNVELFEYSGEDFDTGIPEIDIPMSVLNKALANNVPSNLTTIASGGTLQVGSDGVPIVLDIPDDIDLATGDAQGKNTDIQIESDIILDFNERDPFSEGGTY
jgi:hypothetical protein